MGLGAEGYVTQLEKEESWVVKGVVSEDPEAHQELEEQWEREPNHRGSRGL